MRTPTRMVIVSVLLAPLLVLAVACGDDDDGDDIIDDARTEVTEGVDDVGTEVSDATDGEDDDATPGAGGSEGPSVEISSPEDGDSDDDGDGNVTVSVDASDFDVVDKLGEAAEEGEGHVHYYIDVTEIPTAPGVPAVTGDQTTYHATADTEHTWENVAPGSHTFSVQLVNNDHTPLSPPVTDTVTITVE